MKKIMPELGFPRENIVFHQRVVAAAVSRNYMNTYGMHSIPRCATPTFRHRFENRPSRTHGVGDQPVTATRLVDRRQNPLHPRGVFGAPSTEPRTSISCCSTNPHLRVDQRSIQPRRASRDNQPKKATPMGRESITAQFRCRSPWPAKRTFGRPYKSDAHVKHLGGNAQKRPPLTKHHLARRVYQNCNVF